MIDLETREILSECRSVVTQQIRMGFFSFFFFLFPSAVEKFSL